MENPFPDILANRAGLLTLGVALGENHVFGVISGRTAAAPAACLERLRDEKLFQALEPTWERFSPRSLKISRTEADKTIRLWQEFGAGYFEMSALTRVSAETYCAIPPDEYNSCVACWNEVQSADIPRISAHPRGGNRATKPATTSCKNQPKTSGIKAQTRWIISLKYKEQHERWRTMNQTHNPTCAF